MYKFISITSTPKNPRLDFKFREHDKPNPSVQDAFIALLHCASVHKTVVFVHVSVS